VNEPFFVSCTRGSKEETDLYHSLRKLGADRFHFFEHNQNGLPHCYNSVLDGNLGGDGVIIFAHDDLVLGDLFIREKLARAFGELGYAIAGLAGTSDFKISPYLNPTTWMQPPLEACSGAVEHQPPGQPASMEAYGPAPRRCVVLDGLFLAVDLKKLGSLRFDEQFPFHFYDLDFCLTVHRAGLALGTVNVYVTHRSHGNRRSDDFKHAQGLFHAKWGAGQYRITLHDSTSDGANIQAVSPQQTDIRRNELCHCGSGRKYKHCHGRVV
jgi:SEC-C motif/Glycosyltransferase like family